MGVDFYACTACGGTFPDCGDYTTCIEEFGGCGCMYCSDECAGIVRGTKEQDGEYVEFRKVKKLKPEERTTCVDCRGEHASAENLLVFLLERHGLTRGQVAADYLEKKGASE